MASIFRWPKQSQWGCAWNTFGYILRGLLHKRLLATNKSEKKHEHWMCPGTDQGFQVQTSSKGLQFNPKPMLSRAPSNSLKNSCEHVTPVSIAFSTGLSTTGKVVFLQAVAADGGP